MLEDDGSDAGLIRILSQARLAVLPILGSSIAASGISTCLNAMLLGKFVIGTAGPGMSDIFSEETLIVPPVDPDSLAEQIRLAWENRSFRSTNSTDAAAASLYNVPMPSHKLRRLVRYVGAWANFRQVSRLRFEDPESLFDGVSGFQDGFFGAIQVRSEITQAMREVHAIQPRYVVEVGTSGGGTLLMWSRVAHPEATIISIDLPGFPFGAGYSPLRTPLLRRIGLPGQEVHLVRANSQLDGTVDRVKRHLAGHQVDFLFIDADHSEQGVRTDYALYSPLVRAGGMIMFHDIGVEGRADFGVHNLWRELAASHSHKEFFGDPVTYGIGLIYAQCVGSREKSTSSLG